MSPTQPPSDRGRSDGNVDSDSRRMRPEGHLTVDISKTGSRQKYGTREESEDDDDYPENYALTPSPGQVSHSILPQEDTSQGQGRNPTTTEAGGQSNRSNEQSPHAQTDEGSDEEDIDLEGDDFAMSIFRASMNPHGPGCCCFGCLPIGRPRQEADVSTVRVSGLDRESSIAASLSLFDSILAAPSGLPPAPVGPQPKRIRPGRIGKKRPPKTRRGPDHYLPRIMEVDESLEAVSTQMELDQPPTPPEIPPEEVYVSIHGTSEDVPDSPDSNTTQAG